MNVSLSDHLWLVVRQVVGSLFTQGLQRCTPPAYPQRRNRNLQRNTRSVRHMREDGLELLPTKCFFREREEEGNINSRLEFSIFALLNAKFLKPILFQGNRVQIDEPFEIKLKIFMDEDFTSQPVKNIFVLHTGFD